MQASRGAPINRQDFSFGHAAPQSGRILLRTNCLCSSTGVRTDANLLVGSPKTIGVEWFSQVMRVDGIVRFDSGKGNGWMLRLTRAQPLDLGRVSSFNSSCSVLWFSSGSVPRGRLFCIENRLGLSYECGAILRCASIHRFGLSRRAPAARWSLCDASRRSSNSSRPGPTATPRRAPRARPCHATRCRVSRDERQVETPIGTVSHRDALSSRTDAVYVTTSRVRSARAAGTVNGIVRHGHDSRQSSRLTVDR